VTQPPFVGPPPLPPREPVPRRVSHVLHLLLTVITGGLWAPVWLLIGLDAARADKYGQQRYDDETARYQVAYDEWQRRYHEVYGHAPNATFG
jgi:hypothetical protein